mgnify:CR=1 FL=1|jgi:hypothetical protein
MEIVANKLSAHYKERGESFLHLYNRTDSLDEKFSNHSIDGIIGTLEFKQSILKPAEKRKITRLLISSDWASISLKNKIAQGTRGAAD